MIVSVSLEAFKLSLFGRMSNRCLIRDCVTWCVVDHGGLRSRAKNISSYKRGSRKEMAIKKKKETRKRWASYLSGMRQFR